MSEHLVVSVAGLEVKSQFETGRCEQSLERRESWLTKVPFVGGDHGRGDACTLCQLPLAQSGFHAGEYEDRGRGGSQLIRLCHGTIVLQFLLHYFVRIPSSSSSIRARLSQGLSPHDRMLGMTRVGVHEAKTHLSELLRRVATGEEILIVRGGQPAARLVPVEQAGKRLLGTCPDIRIAADFDAPLPDDVIDTFYR